MTRGRLLRVVVVAIARAKLGTLTNGKRTLREFMGSDSVRQRSESKRKNKTRDVKKDVDLDHPP
jgi:hypothetical protein